MTDGVAADRRDASFAEELDGIEGLQRAASLSRQLAAQRDVDEVLQAIVDLSVGYLQHCDGASLMFVDAAGKVITPASTDLAAFESDQAQYRNDEGPCLSAMRTHDAVVIEDLAEEERWPDWREEVASLGWQSMTGLRLFVGDDTMGALNLYAREPGAFPPPSALLAEVFASIAAVAMKGAISEAGLRRALESRDVIGQAKGILMEREGLTGEQAFERLRRVANEHGRKIRGLAQDISETGDVPDGP